MSGNALRLCASLNSDELPAATPGAPVECSLVLEPRVALGSEVGWSTSANICLLVDCSGSMSGDKITAAVLTAEMVVEMLHERHQLSLVAFDDASRIVFKNEIASDDNKENLAGQIYELDRPLYGMTNLAAGLESAMECFAEGTADTNIALIISDGEPDSVEDAQRLAEEASHRGVQFFAVGIGEDYRADQLLSMVSPSNGSVYADDEVERLDEIFRGIVERIERIFATNVRLNVAHDERLGLDGVDRLAPDRAALDLTKLDCSTGNLNLKVGNIEDESLYEFLLSFELGDFEPGTTELLAVRLDYDFYDNGVKSQESQEVSIEVCFVEQEPEAAPDIDECDEAVEEPAPEEHLYEPDTDPNELWAEIADDAGFGDGGIVCEVGEVEQISLGGDPEPFEDDFEPSGDGIIVEEYVLNEKKADRPARDPGLFDLVLIDAGENPIRLMREIRDAIEIDVHRAADLIRRTNTVVTTLERQAEAEALMERLAAVGARAEIRTHEGVPEPG